MNITALFDQVPYNTSKRLDCPFCFSKNTLSITKSEGKVRWNCFEASCPLKPGIRPTLLSRDDASSLLVLRKPLEGRTEVKQVFAIPPYWIQGLASKKCFQMLLKHNALESYSLGLFKVAYDPRQDRLVYLIQNNNGSVVGAVGRTLSNGIPKVINYLNSEKRPFTCGTGNIGVLVEDCASACSIGRFKDYTGIALLGTKLSTEHLLFIINNYTKLIIAMDKDATYKSIKFRKALEYYITDISIWKLSKDLKNMSKTEVHNLINYYNTKLSISNIS